ncbi:protein-L-isoaspartate O-methyltransferase [Halobacteriales archaeon QS_4_69_34]|nr:MAG: protein-L-isoaspartate O-methyltransferase [Halobacteriales archaeon QS_4_69_34]
MTDFRTRRERLVDRLESRGRVERRATLDALRAVPRHAFVPEGQSRAAYEDRPLPIGEGQTISAPHMVGIMTDLLAPRPGDRILEIGTGCGYHAAVTSEIVAGGRADGGRFDGDRRGDDDGADDGGGDDDGAGDDDTGNDTAGGIYSVEYHERLAERARERLAELGYGVAVRTGDGHDGWPTHAPYDAAYLTCAASEIPASVIEQVHTGGRIVAPVEAGRLGGQTLVRATKRADGGLDREEHGGVRFVSMQGSE